LNLALAITYQSDPNYIPAVHKTIVHAAPDIWPNSLDPLSYFSEVPALYLGSLIWDRRESIDVPLLMQSTILSGNLKYQAVSEHQSQGGPHGYLDRFVHKDEFFWVENLLTDNQPPIVVAASDQAVDEGVLVYLDGSGSTDSDGDVLSYHWTQVGGIAVSLSDSDLVNPSFQRL